MLPLFQQVAFRCCTTTCRTAINGRRFINTQPTIYLHADNWVAHILALESTAFTVLEREEIVRARECEPQKYFLHVVSDAPIQRAIGYGYARKSVDAELDGDLELYAGDFVEVISKETEEFSIGRIRNKIGEFRNSDIEMLDPTDTAAHSRHAMNIIPAGESALQPQLLLPQLPLFEFSKVQEVVDYLGERWPQPQQQQQKSRRRRARARHPRDTSSSAVADATGTGTLLRRPSDRVRVLGGDNGRTPFDNDRRLGGGVLARAPRTGAPGVVVEIDGVRYPVNRGLPPVRYWPSDQVGYGKLQAGAWSSGMLHSVLRRLLFPHNTEQR